MSEKLKNIYFLLFISVPVIALDQISKFWALSLQHNPPIAVFDSWFHFRYAENRGALWGLGNNLPEFYRKLIFLGFSSLITLFILYMLFAKKDSKILKAVYALVFGGAIGNLYDRFFRGFVVDFIDWHLGDIYHWPTFNIADAAIVAAVVLLLIEFFLTMKKEEKAKI